MADLQNTDTFAKLIAEVLEPRDDVASAVADGSVVSVRTQAGELFELRVWEHSEP